MSVGDHECKDTADHGTRIAVGLSVYTCSAFGLDMFLWPTLRVPSLFSVGVTGVWPARTRVFGNKILHQPRPLAVSGSSGDTHTSHQAASLPYQSAMMITSPALAGRDLLPCGRPIHTQT